VTASVLENEWAPDAPAAGDAPAPEPAPEPDPKDPDAPYGRTRSGAPRRKPGPKGPRTARAPGRARPSATSSSARRRPQAPDYASGVRGLVQLVAAPMFLAGQRNPAALADAATLIVHADALGAGAQAVAEADSRVAQFLDRLLAAGPWAAMVAPLVALGVQIGVNHGLIPLETGRGLGAMAPEQLVEHVTGMPAAA